MNKFKLYGIIFIIFIFLISNFIRLNNISSVFNKSGSKLIKTEVTGFANIKESSLEKAVEKLFKSSHINSNYEIKKNKDYVELISKSNNQYVYIKAKRMYDKNLIYTSFLLSQEGDKQNINDIRRTIFNAYKLYAVEPSFYSLMQGVYKEKMNIKKMEKTARKILKGSGAIFTNGMSDDRLVSLYGFVPGMKDKVKLIDGYENLNVALRYSNTNGCTYIWVGSPVITIDY